MRRVDIASGPIDVLQFPGMTFGCAELNAATCKPVTELRLPIIRSEYETDVAKVASHTMVAQGKGAIETHFPAHFRCAGK